MLFSAKIYGRLLDLLNTQSIGFYKTERSKMWIVYACASAFFAGITSILAKCGIKKTDSTVATAVRTIIVLLTAVAMVFIVGSAGEITKLSAKTWIFLVLSGIATGASWLCYFKALKNGDINKVVPVDKSSGVLVFIFSFIFLGEEFTPLKILGVVLIGAGTFLMIEKKKSPASKTLRDTEKNELIEKNEIIGNSELIEKNVTEETENDTVKSEIGEAVEVSEAKNAAQKSKKRYGWFFYAALSAVFAAITSILGKAGVDGVDSHLGTAIRTAVVLVVSWAMVFIAGKGGEIKKIEKRELIFIILSGLATGLSWLCYYKALKNGEAGVVSAIDKMSIIITVAFSFFVFNEKLSLKALIGLVVMISGTLLTVIF